MYVCMYVRDDGVLGQQWHQLDDMQTICTSLQTDNHTNNSLLNFYMPAALDAQPTVIIVILITVGCARRRITSPPGTVSPKPVRSVLHWIVAVQRSNCETDSSQLTTQRDRERLGDSEARIVLQRNDTGERGEVTWRDVTELERSVC